ncbi:sentrin-specific protease 1-like [Olea europaea subsp. europaea]|uniref:Sentrin-specific protease 1-like n=1 Tax=Olea europaea subsp. europaea TaxID=158383 RepID=A0A8S0PVJ1_OLEEU|nr:sentrin-specific protease 1-like [Olea europaea subsp. europaea]
MNAGEACDVNEDPRVHVQVQNDENEDGNEEREVEDYVLANKPVLVKETTLPTDGNEQKQADDMNNCPNLIKVENEQRQATNFPNDDQTHVEERDTCVSMDFISHGDVMESIPTVVEDESDKSSQIGRRMRIKKMSLVLESSFTNPKKRRKLHNVNAFDPFRELDPAKADDLQNWLVNVPDRGDCGIYAINFIELLLAGLDVKLMSDAMIESWRKKLAIEVFAMHFDP